MGRGKIGIITDCGCDLTRTLCEEWGIDVVPFLIQTDTGVFMDGVEITSENIVEYMLNGGAKAITSAPKPEIYQQAYLEKLKTCDSIIFISLSAAESSSYQNALRAVSMMGEAGKQIHVVDSKQLSTGQGLLVLRAAELAQTDMEIEQILAELTDLRERISTTFITENADFLYMNGRVSQSVRDWCRRLSIHPILMMKNGDLTLKMLGFGNYEQACHRYLKRELRHAEQIDPKRVFVTHVKCPVKMLRWIKSVILETCTCENLIVTNASAAISSNCGKNTFGVLFIRNTEQKPAA